MYHQYVLYLNKKLKLERLTDSGDEFVNVANTAVYWQIWVAYVLFIFNIFIFIYISIFYSGLVPVAVRILLIERPCLRRYKFCQLVFTSLLSVIYLLLLTEYLDKCAWLKIFVHRIWRANALVWKFTICIHLCHLINNWMYLCQLHGEWGNLSLVQTLLRHQLQ